MLVNLPGLFSDPCALTATGEDATVDHPRRLTAVRNVLLVGKLPLREGFAYLWRMPMSRSTPHVNVKLCISITSGGPVTRFLGCNHRETVILHVEDIRGGCYSCPILL
jgi:hypothetical protein